MKKILPLVLIVFALYGHKIFAQGNAPVSTIGTVTVTGSTATVNITATDFTDIGSCNLQLLYDPAVAICTSVAKGALLPGGLATNIATPGLIRFGWYTYPGLTLPDNSVIFVLTFTRVSYGTTLISFDDTYDDRQWSNGNSITLNDLPLDTYYIDGSLTFQGDAPITIAPFMATCPGSSISVPITVLNFNTIGVISLTMQYNSSVLTYQSYTNTSGFPDLLASNPIAGYITISGFSTTTGITLPDNATLITLNFTYLGGTTDLTWYDDGTSCEYGGPPLTYTVLNDIPASTYYIPGQISELCNSYWTGNIDDDWFNSGNWTNGIPSTTKDAIVPVVDPNPYPVITGNADCKEADIAAAASITIETAGTLTAHNDFNNDGSLIIKSTATGDGSFIDNGTITGSGSASIERYLESQKWHFVSPPISDGVSNIFYDIYLRWYNEQNGSWNFIVPVDIPLTPMKGYEAWASDFYTGSTTVTYIGSLNTAVQNSGNLTNTLGLGSTGYNLVGNPYPSAIDWNSPEGWNKNHIDNAIYFWNPYAGQYATYINGSGTNGGTNIIPSGQGYFVHVNNNFSTGSLEVNNEARLHHNQAFLKSGKEIENAFLKLYTYSDLSPYSDETIIQFNENATTAFDSDLDGYKIDGLAEAPEFYTQSDELSNLSVNSLPELNGDMTIPLFFKAGTDGIYTISAVDILNFAEKTEIILEDKKIDIKINLREQDSYIFFATVLDDLNRFNLHFLDNSFGTNEYTNSSGIQIFAADDHIYLTNVKNTMTKGTINVFDILGKNVLTKDISFTGNYQLLLDQQGILMVTFFDKSEGKTFKNKVMLH